MVQPQFKESTVVIIDTGRRIIRAGRGLGDLLPAPTVNLKARVGLRRNDIARLQDGHSAMDTADSSTSTQRPPPKGLRPSSYLVGHRLEEVLATGEEVEIWWPFEDGKVGDWVQAEALWKYVLFQGLHLRRTLNEFPVLLSMPKPLSHPTYQLLAQLFFERFNVAALSINDRAVVQLFAANQISGIVVDVDDYTTDITCVHEGMVLTNGHLTVSMGITDCVRHLAGVLSMNGNTIAALSPPGNPLSPQDLHAALLRFSQFLLDKGHIHPPAALMAPTVTNGEEDDPSANLANILVAGKEKALLTDFSTKKKNVAKGAAEREKEKERLAMDLIDVEFEGVKITIGKERHRLCEPFLDGDLVKTWIRQGLKDEMTCMTLAEAVNTAVRELDLPTRNIVWEAVQVTGKLGEVKNFGAALTTQLKPYVARDPIDAGLQPNGQPLFQTDQPKFFKVVSVPGYFAHYHDTGDEMAAFLGGSIVAKLTFNDPTGRFLSKSDYSSKGPSAISEFV